MPGLPVGNKSFEQIVLVDAQTGDPVGGSTGLSTTGAIAYYPDDINTAADVLAKYQYTPAAGHHLRFQRTVNGQAIISLLADPSAVGTISYLDYINSAKMPMALEYEASYEGRGRVAHAGVVLGNFDEPAAALPAPVEVQQWWIHATDSTADYVSASGAFMVLRLVSPLPPTIYIGDWINVTGTSDNAAPTTGFSAHEYANCPIRHISDDRLRVVIGVSDEAAIASANQATKTAIPGTMFIRFFHNMLGATHGMGIRFSGATATSAAMFTAMGSDSFITAAASNDIRSSQLVTVGTTVPIYPPSSFGQAEIRPTTRYRMETRVDECSFQDQACDSATIQSNRLTRSSVKPNVDMEIRPRIYMRIPTGASTVAGRIVSISKTASTTCTVTTDSNHGLKVGDAVTVRGVADQTNFANSATTASVASVISATQFTVVWGVSATASSFGGVAVKHRAALEIPGTVSGQAVTNAVWVGATQYLTLTGSATWAGVSAIGGVVSIKGCFRTGGLDTGLDGLWRVHHIMGTTLTLTPIFDAFGVRISPNPADFSGTAGGFVIVAPEFRIHDLSVEDWTEHRVIVDGQGSNRADKALPVIMASNPAVNQGGAGSIASDGNGGWFVRPAIAALTDIASAAITATATSSALGNNFGNSFQVNIAVTAATGTTPTLDVRIEESFDGGTNWVTLYDFPRITATGSYNSPPLRATGRHIRYVRTVGGGTPSFTMAAIRNVLPFMTAEPQKRMIDRSIVLTTLNSVTPTLFQGEANNVQLVINVGAITTTAPAIQLEGSEDGTNWYPMGSPLTAVASSTVEMTVVDKSATFVRARVSTAGVGVTAGYVSVKAWS